MMLAKARLGALIAFGVVLAGCGQKGPLLMPGADGAPASTAAEPAEDDDERDDEDGRDESDERPVR